MTCFSASYRWAKLELLAATCSSSCRRCSLSSCLSKPSSPWEDCCSVLFGSNICASLVLAFSKYIDASFSSLVSDAYFVYKSRASNNSLRVNEGLSSKRVAPPKISPCSLRTEAASMNLPPSARRPTSSLCRAGNFLS